MRTIGYRRGWSGRLGVGAPATLFLTAVLLSVSVGAAPKPPRYAVHDLGTLSGNPVNSVYVRSPMCLNQQGQIGGNEMDRVSLPPRTNAFLWSKGEMIALPVANPPGLGVTVVGLGENGTVIGTVVSSWIDRRAVVLQNSTWEFLPIPPELANSTAVGINNRGTICGQAEPWSGSWLGPTIPILWRAGEMIKLPLPPNPMAIGAFVSSMNDRDQVVGSTMIVYYEPGIPYAMRTQHATIWDGDDAIDIHDSNGRASNATDISNGGVVVGTLSRSDWSQAPFVWTRVGGLEILPLPPGFQWSSADAISDTGEIVGNGYNAAKGTYGPVLWRLGLAYDLAACLDGILPAYLRVNRAWAINSRGQIVCTADDMRYWAGRILVLDPTGK